MEGSGLGNLKLNSDDASVRKHSNRKATVFAICTIASGFGDEYGNEWMMIFRLIFCCRAINLQLYNFGWQ